MMQYRSQLNRMCFKIISILLCIKAIHGEVGVDYAAQHFQDFSFSESHLRFARLRCLQQHPQADALTFSDTADTHCFLQCFLYKMGLMDLNTRGLDSNKFVDMWDDIEHAFDEKCMDTFDFVEPLSGKCSDCYRKLMEFRSNCLEFFEYTFAENSTWRTEESRQPSKSRGQSTSEYCDSIDEDHGPVMETSQSLEISFLAHYKKRLHCLFQNFHYLDGYGRVDEAEILLSYQEIHMDTPETRWAIQSCAQRANAKFQMHDPGDLVYELQNCLKRHSPEYAKVTHNRDEISREY